MNDPLSDLLANAVVQRFTCRRMQLGGRWTVRMARSDWVRYCTVFDGEVRVEAPLTGKSWCLRTGDTIVFTHGTAHIMSGGSGKPIMITAGDELEEGGYTPMPIIHRHGEGPVNGDVVVGGYMLDRVSARPLLSLLPDIMVLRCENGGKSWKEMQLLDVRRTLLQDYHAGSAGVLRHVASARFAQLVSQFMSRQPNITWLVSNGRAKSCMGTALCAMHEAPQEKWTVDSLARLAAMSRTSFYAAFSETIGEPPMKYLSNLRMARAAELLSTYKVPISTAATEAGYTTTIAFLRSFKRHFGMTPGEYRRKPMQEQAA